MSIKRVLVPVDFSAASLQTLDYAVKLGRPFKAELVVLFVVEPIYAVTPGDLYGATAELTALIDEQRRAGKEQLRKLEERIQKRYPKARCVLQTGRAHQAIVDSARRLKADLIVMATHGRTGISHLLMGSVAEKVVRMAACPVLTLRSPVVGRTARRPRAAKK